MRPDSSKAGVQNSPQSMPLIHDLARGIIKPIKIHVRNKSFGYHYFFVHCKSDLICSQKWECEAWLKKLIIHWIQFPQICFFVKKILSIKIQLSGDNFLSHSDSAFGLRNQLFLRNVKLISNICSWHKSTIVLSWMQFTDRADYSLTIICEEE